MGRAPVPQAHQGLPLAAARAGDELFRDNVALDYYSGGFDGPAEGLLLVHGSVSRSLAPVFLERLQRVAQDFAQQHLADQKLPEAARESYTLVLAMRRWEFDAFMRLRR